MSNFGVFDLKPVSIAPGYTDDRANQRAYVKIQEYVDLKIKPLLKTWTNAESSRKERTLIIQPHIKELKFVSGGKRVLAGALAGSSAVLMDVILTDKEAGAVIGQPELYQRAAAYGGAFSFGGTDNNMLERITQLLQQYLEDNYKEAVGGVTNQLRE